MTREEAIIQIKELKLDKNYMVNGITPFDTALNMAISALEVEPSKDAISRQAITDTTICDGIPCLKCAFHYLHEGNSKCLLHERVNDLPSVIPSRPTGHWIIVQGMNEQCSNCKKFFPLLDFKCRPFEINYCPNCGAKMESEGKHDKACDKFEGYDDV